MSNDLEIDSVWDDDYTIRKKYANHKKIGINQVVIIDGVPQNISILFSKIVPAEQENSNLEDDLSSLVNGIHMEHPYLSKKDILFNYILFSEKRILEARIEEENFEEMSEEEKIKKYIYINLYELLELNIFNKQQSDDGFVLKLYEKYRSWKKNNEEKYDEEVGLIDIVYETLNSANDYSNVLNTVPAVVGATIVYIPEKKNKGSISENDGIGFFDSVVISDKLPIVKYISSKGISYYKTTSRLDVDNNKINIKKADIKNFIYFKICTAKDGLQYDTPDEQLVTFSYDLENNRLRSKIAINEKTISIDDIRDILRQSFPLLSFENTEKNDIKAIIEFYRFDPQNLNQITDVSMIPQLVSLSLRSGNESTLTKSLSKRIDMKKIFGMYMFIDETEKLMIDSKTTRINLMSLTSNSKFGDQFKKDTKFKDISNVLFSLINEEKVGGKVQLVTETGEREEIDFGDSTIKCIKLKIKRCKDEKSLEILTKLFKIFINYYSETEDNKIQNINGLAHYIFKFGGFNGIKDLEQLDKQIKTKGGLKDINKEMFPPGYIRFCQPHRPIIISEEEREEWESKTIVNKDGTISQWPTMLFPRVDEENDEEQSQPQYRMVCPDESAPYIGVRKNTSLSNADKYEYLPCCFKKDQMGPDKSSPYNVYYRGVDNRKTKEKTNYIVKGEKKLEPGQNGEMSPLFEKLINIKGANLGTRRLGISKKNDSFISCVLAAVDQFFLKSRDRDKIVLDTRRKMFEYINCMRQELYHLTDTEIRKILIDDNDSYIDPGLFYRSLEEIYDVNIYIFNISNELIEIPNCWRFHVRYFKQRSKTILIYKNYGNDIGKIPNCELIISHPKDNPQYIGYHFDNNINKILHKFVVDKNSTITWLSEEIGDISGYNNLFKTNYSRMNDVKLLAQYIDSYGKVRLLEINVRGDIFTIMIHPGQPLNLPLIKEIKRIDYQKAITIFGDGVTSVDEKSKGVWFELYDIDEGLFVFTNDLPNAGLKKTSNVFFESRPDEVDEPCKRFRKLQKTSNIIIVLTEWLYDLYIEDDKIEKRPERTKRFIKTRMISGNFKGDSANYYDISNVTYYLPLKIKYPQAFNYVKGICPQLVNNEGQLVYSDDIFKEKMVKYILHYTEKIKGIYPPSKTHIRGYYNCLEDFKFSKGTLLFRGSRDYIRWLKTSSDRYNIKTKIMIDKSRQIAPYEFMRKGRYYIIQNVIGGDFYRAINACAVWNEQKYNPGFTVDSIEEQLIEHIPYKIYGINTIGEVILLEEQGITREGVFYQLLCYGECNEDNKYKRYAAMLPLN